MTRKEIISKAIRELKDLKRLHFIPGPIADELHGNADVGDLSLALVYHNKHVDQGYVLLGVNEKDVLEKFLLIAAPVISAYADDVDNLHHSAAQKRRQQNGEAV